MRGVCGGGPAARGPASLCAANTRFREAQDHHPYLRGPAAYPYAKTPYLLPRPTCPFLDHPATRYAGRSSEKSGACHARPTAAPPPKKRSHPPRRTWHGRAAAGGCGRRSACRRSRRRVGRHRHLLPVDGRSVHHPHYRLVDEKHECRVGHNPQQVRAHPSVEARTALLSRNQPQSLDHGAVLGDAPNRERLLPQARTNDLMAVDNKQ